MDDGVDDDDDDDVDIDDETDDDVYHAIIIHEKMKV